MKTKSFSKRWVGAAFLLAFVACTDDAGSRSSGAQTSTAASALEIRGKQQIALVDFARANARRMRPEERAQRIAKLLGGADEVQVDEGGDPEGVDKEGADQPRRRPALRIAHVDGSDELLMVNGIVADDHDVGIDVGESGARRIFDEALANLTGLKVDDVKGIDVGQVRLARLHQASALNGRPETLRSEIKAYLFSVPRVVNGIEIMDSDLTIGVHRNGKVASIRSRGALPGLASPDVVLGGAKRRMVSAEEIRKRVQEENPNAIVQSRGLVYPVGTPADDSGGRAVEPKEVIEVFERLSDGSGFSRGRPVAYSVTDGSAPGIALDTQLLDDKGDVRQ